MSVQFIMIPNYTRTQILDVIRMRNKGMSATNIAQRKGVSAGTLRRYIRVYDNEGPFVFAQAGLA
jgi:transposase